MFRILIALGFLFSFIDLSGLIEETYSTRIEGPEINRPEGVAFTPDSNYVVVASSKNHSILFYQRIGTSGAHYETTPCFSLQGERSSLYYPHDLAFSPDGRFLAVANSHKNTITIYKKSTSTPYYNKIPVAKIEGTASKLNSPRAVAFHPKLNILVVPNKGSNTIHFYRFNNESFEQKPYQIIEGRDNLFKVPDGVSFSPDGELLAVTSHDTHSVLLFQKISSMGEFSEMPVEILQGEETGFAYNHSVSFHPSNNYLACSSSCGLKTCALFQRLSSTQFSRSPVQTLSIFNPENFYLQESILYEGGVKGLKFSFDGKLLALCASDIEDPTGAILIYTFEP